MHTVFLIWPIKDVSCEQETIMSATQIVPASPTADPAVHATNRTNVESSPCQTATALRGFHLIQRIVQNKL